MSASTVAIASPNDVIATAGTATVQVGLLISQAKAASAQVRKLNGPLVRSALSMVYRAIGWPRAVATRVPY